MSTEGAEIEEWLWKGYWDKAWSNEKPYNQTLYGFFKNSSSS